MIALVLCVLALVVTFWAGRRSLGQGLVALLVFGYFYGILRANLITTFSHFIFDAGLLGLYLSQDWLSSDARKAGRGTMIRMWTAILIIWPFFVLLMPFQPLLISLVGLRGNIFFLPILILGTRLGDKDLRMLCGGLAILNLVAAAFAWAEYFTSVPRFFPLSPVTAIIYSSGDVTGGFFRIPAIFSSAHAYGGSMVVSLPYLIEGWERAETRRSRMLVLLGIAAAMIGVLMSATRQNFILGSVIVLASLVTRRAKASHLAVFALLITGVGWVAMTNVRFQRFKTLSDTEGVTERIAGSVNRGFWEILLEYPMGNGLGGGGTSIPYFLQGEVKNPIGMENEYARILCEQGVVGLMLWIGFAFWFISRAPVAFAKSSWSGARRIVWCLAAFSLATAWIGTGLLTAIPQTMMLLLSMGWVATPQREIAGSSVRPLRPLPRNVPIAVPAVS
jgi:hypothetical protein